MLPDVALKVLHAFEAVGPHDEVTICPHDGGFSGARVYRIQASGRDLALRRWPQQGVAAGRVLAIHRLTRHVIDAGVQQVPLPQPLPQGETLLIQGGDLWQLEPWMPGIADFHQRPDSARLNSALTVLARWHIAAVGFIPSDVERQWLAPATRAPSPTIIERCHSINFLAERLDLIERGVEVEAHPEFRDAAVRISFNFRRLHRHIFESLNACQKIVVPLQPCLKDVWHDHLLFTGDSLTGLIDSGAVRTDTVACDLSRLLTSLFSGSGTRWAEALDAYEAVRPLSLSERSLLWPLSKSGILLSGMTWLKRRYLQRSLPDVTPAVAARLAGLAVASDSLDTSAKVRSSSGLILPDSAP